VGISAVFGEAHTAVVAVAIHDGTYLLDFSVQNLELAAHLQEGEDRIADYVIQELQSYEQKNLSKFIGAGLPHNLMNKAPRLCSRLWAELDTVPVTIKPELEEVETSKTDNDYWDVKCVDEQADSMARKCIM
jgi:hypothetical protein